jgi:hypothetical protein
MADSEMSLGNDDTSGNGNDYTENNLVAANQTIDTPTKNFCTLSPSRNSSGTVSDGNRIYTCTTASSAVAGTMGVTGSGKYYFEVYLSDDPASSTGRVGIISAQSPVGTDADNSVAGRIYRTYGDFTGRIIRE